MAYSSQQARDVVPEDQRIMMEGLAAVRAEEEKSQSGGGWIMALSSRKNSSHKTDTRWFIRYEEA